MKDDDIIIELAGQIFLVILFLGLLTLISMIWFITVWTGIKIILTLGLCFAFTYVIAEILLDEE